eukprot:TRINITY_DN6511_c0_g1_i1.p1 TRINITY_DN6511_c0_g1~~TRINITY_DN6511_c0_g1_i1.p1  ORF type:complete len:490 (+),score=102.44 TRINITY_DN6511_c0_g1_i1:64-1533(+)
MMLKSTTRITKVKLLVAAAIGYLFFVLFVRNEENVGLSQTPPILWGHKFVVYSSDDWGRWTDSVPVWPDKPTWRRWQDEGNALHHPTWGMCGMETFEDLIDLKKQMASLSGSTQLWGMDSKIPFAHRPVITPYFIVGGPHYAKMKEKGCSQKNPQSCEYIEREFDTMEDGKVYRDGDQSIGSEPLATILRRKILAEYKNLYRDGFWHPEYHGRNHFSDKIWIDLLKKGNGNATKCFDWNLVCGDEYGQLRTENTNFEKWEDLADWHEKGIGTFERFWGYKPRVYNCPHNISHHDQRFVLEKLNIIATETYLNQSSKTSVSYLDRIRFDAFTTWWNTHRQLKLVSSELSQSPFAILMWHAQNWMRAVYDVKRSNDLRKIFVDSVEYLRKNHPEVVFVTSAELHQIKKQGWSEEWWSNNLILRNYREEIVLYQVKGGKFKTTKDKKSSLQLFNLKRNSYEGSVVEDETIELAPNSEYYLGYSTPKGFKLKN